MTQKGAAACLSNWNMQRSRLLLSPLTLFFYRLNPIIQTAAACTCRSICYSTESMFTLTSKKRNANRIKLYNLILSRNHPVKLAKKGMFLLSEILNFINCFGVLYYSL